MSERILLGAGQAAKVYLENTPEGPHVRKEFEPLLRARLGYRLIKWKEHPYTAEYAPYVVKAAFELRRVAHRVSKVFSSVVEVVDATNLWDDGLGFYTPYIDNARPFKRSDIAQKAELDRTENFFYNIGLPVWSFGGVFRERQRPRNVLIRDNKAFIVDFEAGWPYPARREIIGFDDSSIVHFDLHLADNQTILEDRLGKVEYRNLLMAWEKYKLYNAFWRTKENAVVYKLQLIKEALDWHSLNDRIQMLEEEGSIESDMAQLLREQITLKKDILRLISPHILIHFCISVPLRFPFGSLARPIYTATMRLVDEAERLIYEDRRHKPQLHTARTAILSAFPIPIPPTSFFAYLTHVLKEDPLSFLIIDNITYRVSGKGFEEKVRDIGGNLKFHRIHEYLSHHHTQFVNQMSKGVEKVLRVLYSEEIIQKGKNGLNQSMNVGQYVGSILPREDILNEMIALIEQKYS